MADLVCNDKRAAVSSSHGVAISRSCKNKAVQACLNTSADSLPQSVHTVRLRVTSQAWHAAAPDCTELNSCLLKLERCCKTDSTEVPEKRRAPCIPQGHRPGSMLHHLCDCAGRRFVGQPTCSSLGKQHLRLQLLRL